MALIMYSERKLEKKAHYTDIFIIYSRNRLNSLKNQRATMCRKPKLELE